MIATLYYCYDPMCSWCWGYRPTLNKLLAKLPAELNVEFILGGLAPDTAEPMPAAMRDTIEGYWRKIQGLLGTEFNFDFWRQCQPRRDTYKACRAIIAARPEGKQRGMLEAIQQAYYLRAMNPSEIDVLLQLAEEIGMNPDTFRVRLLCGATDQQLQKEITQVRQWQVQGFPSLVLECNERRYLLPVDYQDEEVTLKRLKELLTE